MKKLSRLSLGAAAAAAMLLSGLALPQVAQAQPVVVQIAPLPAPYVERVPAARRGQIWSPGHDEWRNGRHVWVRGQWIRARPGYAYSAPEWRQENGQWIYRQARWDRDRDGVPNRYDRDRDGDGVSNRYDRFPGNPRRY